MEEMKKSRAHIWAIYSRKKGCFFAHDDQLYLFLTKQAAKRKLDLLKMTSWARFKGAKVIKVSTPIVL